MKNNKAAMEMSVGTIVTIVLLMSVLVLGLMLTRGIFSSSTDAVTQINGQLQNQINELFVDSNNLKLVIYPTSRTLTVKRDKDPSGFAFSVKNGDLVENEFHYSIAASSTDDCQGSMSLEQANGLLLKRQGSFSLGPGNILENAVLVLFSLSDRVPPCTVVYDVKVRKGSPTGEIYSSADVYVTIK